MITTLILNLLYWVIVAILFLFDLLLPDSPLNFYLPGWQTSLEGAMQNLGLLSQVFPIAIFIQVVVYMFLFEGFLFFYKLLKWSWKKIPGFK